MDSHNKSHNRLVQQAFECFQSNSNKWNVSHQEDLSQLKIMAIGYENCVRWRQFINNENTSGIIELVLDIGK